MSAVTSSPLSLSAEWIPTLLQTSKEVREKGKRGGRNRRGGVDFRGYTTSRGVAIKKMKSYEQYRRRRWIYFF